MRAMSPRRGRISSRLVRYPVEVERALRGEDGGQIGHTEAQPPPPDDYAGRLAKFVPVETVAFAAVFTTIDLPDTGQWTLFVVALVGTPIYFSRLGWQPLLARALTVVAAAAWIVGTTSFGTEVLGLSYNACKATLVAATFAIPAVDLWNQQRIQRRMLQ